MNVRVRRIGFLRPIALLLALVGAAAASDLASVPTALRPIKDRSPAPDFALTDVNGVAVALSHYKDRVVLLDFWATWCTGCKVEIPWYMEFQKKYARRGFASIGVAMDEEGWEKVRPYLQTHPINYPIVLGAPDLEKPYQIESLPVTLLIDRHGRIADAHVGMVVKDTWEKEIQQLLKERYE
jgi:cytochrome c biogenesis protein CcmG/thiol:disulfide interchange protein DsbE